MAGIISKAQPLKTRLNLPFNFLITKMRVVIRLAEDGTRMGGIWFPVSPSLEYMLETIQISNTRF